MLEHSSLSFQASSVDEVVLRLFIIIELWEILFECGRCVNVETSTGKSLVYFVLYSLPVEGAASVVGISGALLTVTFVLNACNADEVV